MTNFYKTRTLLFLATSGLITRKQHEQPRLAHELNSFSLPNNTYYRNSVFNAHFNSRLFKVSFISTNFIKFIHI